MGTGALLMKDSEDLHNLVVVNEIYRVRKASNKNPTSFEEHRRIRERVLRCPLYRGVELQKKLDTQARLSASYQAAASSASASAAA